jgi:hypothetical protein
MPWQCAACKNWCPDTTSQCEHCGEVYDETKYVDVSRLHPLAQKRFYEQLESQRRLARMSEDLRRLARLYEDARRNQPAETARQKWWYPWVWLVQDLSYGASLLLVLGLWILWIGVGGILILIPGAFLVYGMEGLGVSLETRWGLFLEVITIMIIGPGFSYLITRLVPQAEWLHKHWQDGPRWLSEQVEQYHSRMVEQRKQRQ